MPEKPNSRIRTNFHRPSDGKKLAFDAFLPWIQPAVPRNLNDHSTPCRSVFAPSWRHIRGRGNPHYGTISTVWRSGWTSCTGEGALCDESHQRERNEVLGYHRGRPQRDDRPFAGGLLTPPQSALNGTPFPWAGFLFPNGVCGGRAKASGSPTPCRLPAEDLSQGVSIPG